LCHWHTLVIVTDTHQHIDRGLYTYMTSYLAQVYRLSTLIDKPTLFISSWLIRLWVDNVLLINTRSLSILIDKSIPLSIGIPIVNPSFEDKSHKTVLFINESIKWDLKIRPIYQCRCDERLKTKVEESTRLSYTGLCYRLLEELEHLKIKTRLIDEILAIVMGEPSMCSWNDRCLVKVKVNTWICSLDEGTVDFCFQLRWEHRAVVLDHIRCDLIVKWVSGENPGGILTYPRREQKVLFLDENKQWTLEEEKGNVKVCVDIRKKC